MIALVFLMAFTTWFVSFAAGIECQKKSSNILQGTLLILSVFSMTLSLWLASLT